MTKAPARCNASTAPANAASACDWQSCNKVDQIIAPQRASNIRSNRWSGTTPRQMRKGGKMIHGRRDLGGTAKAMRPSMPVAPIRVWRQTGRARHGRVSSVRGAGTGCRGGWRPDDYSAAARPLAQTLHRGGQSRPRVRRNPRPSADSVSGRSCKVYENYRPRVSAPSSASRGIR